jgi:hypothetical protein
LNLFSSDFYSVIEFYIEDDLWELILAIESSCANTHENWIDKLDAEEVRVRAAKLGIVGVAPN